MMKFRLDITVAIVGALAFLPGAGFAQEAPAPPAAAESVEIEESGEAIGAPVVQTGAGTLALLQSLEQRHGAAVNIEGTFEQTKVSEIFLETIESKGKFIYKKPDYFRCDYAPPDEMTNLILKDAIYVHIPEIKQVERYRFHTPEERDQQLHVMTLGFGFKADQILREYSVRSSEDDEELKKELVDAGGDPAKTALLEAIPVPTYADTSPFTRIKLWIDKAALMPEKIWFEDYNEDKTTIKVLDVKFDVEIPEGTFEPKFPAGTEMIDKSDI